MIIGLLLKYSMDVANDIDFFVPALIDCLRIIVPEIVDNIGPLNPFIPRKPSHPNYISCRYYRIVHMDLHKNVTDFFQELLCDLNCQSDTRAYIIGIFGKFRSATADLSKDSATLLFAQARAKQDFLGYQNLADWIFFANSWAPEHLQFASKDYYDTIARVSYYACYRLINRQWKLFEQLADELPILEEQVKRKLNILSFKTDERVSSDK
jgi:hypothetical protein